MSTHTTDNSVNLQTKTHKQRATKAMVKDFVKWALNNNLYDTCTPGRMRQMYLNEHGIDLCECCIRRQRGKWQLVDGELDRILE